MDRQTDGRKDGWVSRSTALCRDTQEVPDSAPKSAPDLLRPASRSFRLVGDTSWVTLSCCLLSLPEWES